MVVYASSTVDVVFRISGYRVQGIGIVASKSDGLQSSGRISKRFWKSYDVIVHFGSFREKISKRHPANKSSDPDALTFNKRH